MGKLTEAIENDVLALPAEDRTRLTLILLDSIDSRPAADPKLTEKAWIAESNRRYQAYLRGDEQAFPAEQVFAELRADER